MPKGSALRHLHSAHSWSRIPPSSEFDPGGGDARRAITGTGNRGSRTDVREAENDGIMGSAEGDKDLKAREEKKAGRR